MARRVQAVLAGPAHPTAGEDPGDGARGIEWVVGPQPAEAEPLAVPATGPAQRLAARLPLRLDPGWRGAAALGVVALLAAVITGVWVRSAQPQALPVSEPGPTVTAAAARAPVHAQASSGAPPAVAGGPPVVVDVAGRVRKPGLYTLPAGARVYDAIMAAGGFAHGANRLTLNLAARVSDGQQIVVGAAGGPPPPGAPDPGPSAAPGAGPPGAGGLVNLNSATLEQLDALPGVGPVLAAHILEWRTAHGSFTTVDQLREVPGIGEVKFAGLRAKVTV